MSERMQEPERAQGNKRLRKVREDRRDEVACFTLHQIIDYPSALTHLYFSHTLPHLLWWGEKPYVQEQVHPHPNGNSTKPKTRIESTKIEWVCEKRAELSIRWRGSCCSGYFRLSAEKCINKELFSCIQIIILNQLHTVFFPFSSSFSASSPFSYYFGQASQLSIMMGCSPILTPRLGLSAQARPSRARRKAVKRLLKLHKK